MKWNEIVIKVNCYINYVSGIFVVMLLWTLNKSTSSIVAVNRNVDIEKFIFSLWVYIFSLLITFNFSFLLIFINFVRKQTVHPCISFSAKSILEGGNISTVIVFSFIFCTCTACTTCCSKWMSIFTNLWNTEGFSSMSVMKTLRWK